MTQSKDADANITTTTYDRLGRRVAQTYPVYTPPGGSSITPSETTTFDSVGNVSTATDRRGQVSSYQYDSMNRVARVTSPGVGGINPISTTVYDDVGNVTQTVDPIGATINRVYDDLNRLRAKTSVVRQPAVQSFTDTMDYDSLGNMTSHVDPVGNTSSSAFNGASEQTSGTDPLGFGTTYTHDVGGRVTQMVDPVGRKTTNVFDLAGRRTQRAKRDATGTALIQITSTFDANGNVLTTTNLRNAPTTYAYDAANRLTSTTRPGIAASTYGYDTRSLLTKITNGLGFTTWSTHQSWGLLESTIEPVTAAFPGLADRTFTTAYDAGGLPVSESQPGSVTVNRTYDTLGRSTGENASGPGVPAAARTLTLDLAGRATAISHPPAPSPTATMTVA